MNKRMNTHSLRSFVCLPIMSTQKRTQLFSNVKPPRKPIQRTDAMYDQLEAQHDEVLSTLGTKINMLKDLTSRIGGEVKESTSLLSAMEGKFDGAKAKVKSTMNRMVAAADRSGISWRSYLILTLIVLICFWLVMIF